MMETTVPIGTKKILKGITLTMTEEGWRAELQHSMMRRCEGWDCCQPWIYLVTVGCQHHEVMPRPVGIPEKEGSAETITPLPHDWQLPAWLQEQYRKAGRPHLFGELAGTKEQPIIALNEFGAAVDKEIMAIPASFPEVSIIERVVMPNHIHIVIRVHHRLPEKKPLGYIINKLKSWVNRRYKELCLDLPANTLMEVAQPVKSSSPGAKNSEQPQPQHKKRHGTHPKNGLVFEAGFHDRILFREGQLANMIDYCRDNPRRLWNVVNNSQYFRVVNDVVLTLPIIANGGTKGHGRCRQFFDACASGQLLMMSPWIFQNGVSHVKRWQCLFLNDIAAQLVIAYERNNNTYR